MERTSSEHDMEWTACALGFHYPDKPSSGKWVFIPAAPTPGQMKLGKMLDIPGKHCGKLPELFG